MSDKAEDIVPNLIRELRSENTEILKQVQRLVQIMDSDNIRKTVYVDLTQTRDFLLLTIGRNTAHIEQLEKIWLEY